MSGAPFPANDRLMRMQIVIYDQIAYSVVLEKKSRFVVLFLGA
jgi:hypothetical protein